MRALKSISADVPTNSESRHLRYFATASSFSSPDKSDNRTPQTQAIPPARGQNAPRASFRKTFHPEPSTFKAETPVKPRFAIPPILRPCYESSTGDCDRNHVTILASIESNEQREMKRTRTYMTPSPKATIERTPHGDTTQPLGFVPGRLDSRRPRSALFVARSCFGSLLSCSSLCFSVGIAGCRI
jgi:hypothetical protein